MHITNLLQEINIHPQHRAGITIAPVTSLDQGVKVGQYLLEKFVDKKTVLFLSGGKTPRQLYERLAYDEQFTPGAIGMVDERFGEKLHQQSNERMLEESGLLKGLSWRDIAFYPLLKLDAGQASMTSEDTADIYDQTVRELLQRYQKSVAILGVGTDGHTAGLLANSKWHMANRKETEFVTSYESSDQFKQRISMSFLGLSMLDILILFVFGYDKAIALEAMFSEGSEEEVPARFYIRPDIAKKTLLITDQRVV